MMNRAAVNLDSVDDRIAKSAAAPQRTFNHKTKSRQKTPLTTQGFDPYVQDELVDEKTKIVKSVKIGHASGPLNSAYHRRIIEPSFLGENPTYDENLIHNWVPSMGLSVVDNETGRPLSAATIAQKRTDGFVPSFFTNPMQDLDYMVIEAMQRQTFIGPLMDALVKFIVGTGFKPELELLNPSGNEDKDQRLREENQDVIDALVQIDKQIEEDQNYYHDVSFTEKITAMISGMLGFNRSALLFGYDQAIEVDNQKYKNIPSSLIFSHPRDLGIIEVAPNTHRLKSVQYRHAFYQVPTKDMIYAWNPVISAKTRNSWLYGDSMVMPMLDASRVIRKNIGVNFPAMAEATWAGLFILGIRPQGQTAADKDSEYSDIANRFVTGGPNVLLEAPEDLSFNSIDYNPKVTEFKDLTEFLLKYCVATIGLPQTMFYDEASANRATMIGKIQLARDTVINPMREWIGRGISSQWYQRWFREIYKEKKPDLYKQFRIKLAFDDIHIEEWYDKIEAVLSLDSRKPLKDASFGEMSGIDNYQNKVEEEGETTPGGNGSGKEIKLGSGETLKLKQPKEQIVNS